MFSEFRFAKTKANARTEGGREAPARGGGSGAGRDASATAKWCLS
jgi:hypothetical protein